MDERWNDIPGYAGVYQVSTLGRVRSLPRKTRSGQILKLQMRLDGYQEVELWGVGGKTRFLVHRLVATAFCARDRGQDVVRHANADRADNRVENLSWGTHTDNSLDCIAQGRHIEASRTHCRRGHAFDEQNTYIDKQGHRNCRTCRREASRKAQQALRERNRGIAA